VASLVLGILGLPTFGLLGVGALLAVVLGVAALAKAREEPHVYGGKGLAIAGIVCSGVSLLLAPFVGIVAAIAIPSLLRVRAAANQSAVIRDIRDVIVAEAEYQRHNAGYYGTLECLNVPRDCLGTGAPTTPLVPPELLLPERAGYRRTFYPGRDAGYSEGHPHQYLQTYAYVAYPSSLGATNVRILCGDSTGRICFVTPPEEMKADYGLCPKACTDLR
jgi:type II secretory pathway pseudopilin PulG